MIASVSWAETKNAYYYDYDEAEDGLTEDTAYIIRNGRDLFILARRVDEGTEPYGRYYRLEQDLTHITIPIGKASKPFTGHFDGCGHTIKLNSILFGTIDTNGYAVRNLNIANGDFAGITDNLVSGIIYNCNVKGVIKSQKVTGGIAARVFDGGIIRGCTVNASIDINTSYISDSCAGGIAGQLEGGMVERCRFTGTISAGGNTAYAGGIVGYSDGGIIADCTASASVRAYSGSHYGESYAGGIAGLASYTTITHNISGGSVRAEHWAGGIAGKIIAGSADRNRAGAFIRGRAVHSGEIAGETEGGCRIEGNSYTVTTEAENSGNVKRNTKPKKKKQKK